jgi:short subunit fatty acids transporter
VLRPDEGRWALKDIALISLGVIVQALTFGLGILVGATLRRTEARRVANLKESRRYHPSNN